MLDAELFAESIPAGPPIQLRSRLAGRLRLRTVSESDAAVACHRSHHQNAVVTPGRQRHRTIDGSPEHISAATGAARVHGVHRVRLPYARVRCAHNGRLHFQDHPDDNGLPVRRNRRKYRSTAERLSADGRLNGSAVNKHTASEYILHIRIFENVLAQARVHGYTPLSLCTELSHLNIVILAGRLVWPSSDRVECDRISLCV